MLYGVVYGYWLEKKHPSPGAEGIYLADWLPRKNPFPLCRALRNKEGTGFCLPWKSVGR